MHPRVALTCSARAYARYREGGARELRRFVECLQRAGAQPFLAPVGSQDGLGAAQGLLLPGGVDVHPGLYGEGLAGTEQTDGSLDRLELALIDEARARGLPILGICRGMQVLNVALGGSLEQHVDGHRSATGEASAYHTIEVDSGSAFARLLGATGVFSVNSRHHQAVTPRRLAPGLRAAAWTVAPGHAEIVEAVEGIAGWLFGVQCHPERASETPASFEKLFDALVVEASKVSRLASMSRLRERSA